MRFSAARSTVPFDALERIKATPGWRLDQAQELRPIFLGLPQLVLGKGAEGSDEELSDCWREAPAAGGRTERLRTVEPEAPARSLRWSRAAASCCAAVTLSQPRLPSGLDALKATGSSRRCRKAG